MTDIVLAILTPALIASLVTLAINIRMDKLKAHREYITTTFEAAKKVVDDAIKASIEYFPLRSKDRSNILEARVWLYERELRFAVPSLMSGSSEKLSDELGALTIAFDDLISLLTGGSFQSSDSEGDMKQARLIASAGAELKAKLTDLRHAELKSAIDRDILTRFIGYWTEPHLKRI